MVVSSEGRTPKTRWESPPAPDALTAVIDSLHLEGKLFCRIELSAPWGLALARGELAHFHVMERGGCWLKVPGGAAAVSLAAGDLVVIPHGTGHSLADSPDTPPVPLWTRTAWAGGGRRAMDEDRGRRATVMRRVLQADAAMRRSRWTAGGISALVVPPYPRTSPCRVGSPR